MNITIEDLAIRLAKNPGITRRSAHKLLFHFIRNKEKIDDFIKILQKVEEEISTCKSCGNVAFESFCNICSSSRNKSVVCVVEDFEDVGNLEKGGWYDGVYHVLGGLLSAQKNMLPENLNTKPLLEKVKMGQVVEIIFASTSSFEWQATMHFIVHEVKKLNENVKITEFAHGLPVGSSLEYMDEGTLQIAFSCRRGV